MVLSDADKVILKAIGDFDDEIWVKVLENLYQIGLDLVRYGLKFLGLKSFWA